MARMKLHEWRAQKGLSQKDVADLFGVSQTTIDRYEDGERTPSDQMMARILEKTEGAVGPFDFLPAASAALDRIQRTTEANPARARARAHTRGARA